MPGRKNKNNSTKQYKEIKVILTFTSFNISDIQKNASNNLL